MCNVNKYFKTALGTGYSKGRVTFGRKFYDCSFLLQNKQSLVPIEVVDIKWMLSTCAVAKFKITLASFFWPNISIPAFQPA